MRFFKRKKKPIPTVDVTNLPQAGVAPARFTDFNGSKFFGGFGTTEVQLIDYWTLRLRSTQLYNENLYARGMLRRLITNEINTGLVPEVMPDEMTLGLAPDSQSEWSENVENRFSLYAASAKICDFNELATFDSLQRAARLEALVGGDVLVVVGQSKQGLPNIRLINGAAVRQPLGVDMKLKNGNRIVHGVELDKRGRHVAFHVVTNELGKTRRITAKGAKTGRPKAWLLYGTDKRHDVVRGQPLLGLVLQSLKEVDRYRDSATRRAVVNSFLAMFIKKTENKPGSKPITGGAVRKDSVSVEDPSSPDGVRSFDIAQQVPGLVFEELQVGEEPVAFDSKTDVNFGPFEEAIVQAIAWANEIPPEILRLAFSNNYSASQAAINEFKIYLNLIRSRIGKEFCQPIYVEWLVSEALLGKIDIPGFLAAWRDPTQYDIFAAWVVADWTGAIKPSTDIKKQAQGYKLMVDECWITNDRASRELTGTKFSKNVKRIKRENELKVEAIRPILELQKEFGSDQTTAALAQLGGAVENINDVAESLNES